MANNLISFIKIVTFIILLPIACTKKESITGEQVYTPLPIQEYNVSIKDEISDISVFNRCYSSFTRRPLPQDHSLLKELKDHKITGKQACHKILDSVTLNSNGEILGSLKGSIQLARNLHYFHNSWFKSVDFHTSNDNWGNLLVNDTEEMALYFTKNLLAPEYELKRTVTSSTPLEAIRESNHESDFLIFRLNDELYPNERFGYYTGTDPKKPRLWSPSPKELDLGQLSGITDVPKNRDVLKHLAFGPNHDEISTEIDINKNFGAGFIGSSPYILLNYNLNNDKKSDGGILLHRRWAKNVFMDAFCRELPLVYEEDATAYTVPESGISFQKMNKCMKCHMSTDPAAGVLRNIYSGRSNEIAGAIDLADSDDFGYIQLRALNESEVTEKKNTEHFIGKPDPEFHKRPPTGELIFRNIYGQLVNIKVNNLTEFGEAISEQDDYYACISKRYLRYLTGINIDLNQLTHSYAKASAKDRYMADFLMHLTQGLKATQSIKSLIKTITGSPLYRSAHFDINVKLKKNSK